MSDDDNVKRLPVRFKQPPGDEQPMLKLVSDSALDGCNHRNVFVRGEGLGGRFVPVQYLIRAGETEVECGHCKTRLDPMFVLQLLAREETRWLEAGKRYAAEMQRLSERERTECEHCGKQTRISRAKAKRK